ncbi:MAG: metallophosphoesterase [Kiritimatiellia bacterium]
MTTRRIFLEGLGAAGVLSGRAAPRADGPVVRFGFISDCHYAAHIVRPGDNRRYPQALRKLDEFAAAMNREGVDFVVEGGDFKDLGRTPAESLAYLDAAESRLAGFKGPRYHVLGNHDHDNLAKDEFLAHVANAGQPAAKAWYSFTRGGIRFIVLDACYRPDGTPYCRGNFSWKEAFIPREQVDFLRAELASAPGPCVPIVHQQLDAEDETCIRNAAEIRAILERSGKVSCVLQGHFHEGSFRDVNGIGYYTAKASVIGDAPEANAFALVEIDAGGRANIRGFNSADSISARAAGGWEGGCAWRPGHYQVHCIYTGRGESTFHVFPDGTSLLLDCGDSMRFHQTPAETPLLPDLSRRSGEWIARYVERVNPKGRRVDYFHLSHYHEDHGGGERYHAHRVSAPTGDYWCSGLADAARFLSFDTVVDRAWPGFGDPLDALATSRDGTARNIRAVYARLAAEGTRIETFRLGAKDQFVQRDGARARPDFQIFNLCANGRYVRKDGSVRDLYADRIGAGAKTLNENGLSCGFIVSYGRFRYFTAGDFSDACRRADGSREQTEDLLAEAVGPVDVAKMNHHGHHSMFPELVKALRARVWTACVLDQQHVTDDSASRLADRTLYPGARTILPTYMPLNRPETPAGRAYLSDVPQAVRAAPCHLVLDVPPGGASYSVSCLSAADETDRVVARFGFFATAKDGAAHPPPARIGSRSS